MESEEAGRQDPALVLREADRAGVGRLATFGARHGRVLGEEVGQDWYKATISIQAHPTKPWTARAVRPDGSLGTEFTFAPKKK